MSEFTDELKKLDLAINLPSKTYFAIEEKFKDWQPPKPLVVVPQLVARYIETEKDNDCNRVGTLVYGHYKAIDEFKYSELDEWIANNFDTFLEAIVNGYTVEKEQMFYLREKNTDYYLTKSKNHSFLKLVINPYFDENDEFTQSEIDELHIGSYEQIPVKVDEVE